MKTILKPILLMAVFAIMASTSNAQVRVFVRTRPVAPVVVRPVAPNRESVWIGGEWVWRGGRYEYVNPHYERVRRGHVWIGGHWRYVRGGYVWVAGYWR